MKIEIFLGPKFMARLKQFYPQDMDLNEALAQCQVKDLNPNELKKFKAQIFQMLTQGKGENTHYSGLPEGRIKPGTHARSRKHKIPALRVHNDRSG
jgi:hypothetical protein